MVERGRTSSKVASDGVYRPVLDGTLSLAAS